MNRLKVKRDGALIEAYANGELLASVSDGSYTGVRHVGLIVATYDVQIADVFFDNFVVYPVTCTAEPPLTAGCLYSTCKVW